jgi:hypothetical protein
MTVASASALPIANPARGRPGYWWRRHWRARLRLYRRCDGVVLWGPAGGRERAELQRVEDA